MNRAVAALRLWKLKRSAAAARARARHDVSHTAVCKLLKEMDYRLQANKKTLEGANHIDRDAQFEYINKRAKSFIR
jgi:hypothetical protein